MVLKPFRSVHLTDLCLGISLLVQGFSLYNKHLEDAKDLYSLEAARLSIAHPYNKFELKKKHYMRLLEFAFILFYY
jgi:hypothetical protein